MTNIDDLIARLRGEYRIPITDGLGPAGGEEPDNPNEFVRRFPTVPIQVEAADALTAAQKRIADLKGVLRGIVEVADTRPSCPVGHVIEHEVSSARAALSKGSA